MLYNDIRFFIAGVEFPFSDGIQIDGTGLYTVLRVIVRPEDRPLLAALPISRMKQEDIPVRAVVSLPDVMQPAYPADYITLFEGMASLSVTYDRDSGLVTMRVTARPVLVHALSGIKYADLSIGSAFNTVSSSISSVNDRNVSVKEGDILTVATAPTPATSLNSVIFQERLIMGSTSRKLVDAPSDIYEFAMHNLLQAAKATGRTGYSDPGFFTTGPRILRTSFDEWRKDYLNSKLDTSKVGEGSAAALEISGSFQYMADQFALYKLVVPRIGELSESILNQQASSAYDSALKDYYHTEFPVRMRKRYETDGLWFPGRYVMEAIADTYSDAGSSGTFKDFVYGNASKLPDSISRILHNLTSRYLSGGWWNYTSGTVEVPNTARDGGVRKVYIPRFPAVLGVYDAAGVYLWSALSLHTVMTGDTRGNLVDFMGDIAGDTEEQAVSRYGISKSEKEEITGRIYATITGIELSISRAVEQFTQSMYFPAFVKSEYQDALSESGTAIFPFSNYKLLWGLTGDSFSNFTDKGSFTTPAASASIWEALYISAVTSVTDQIQSFITWLTSWMKIRNDGDVQIRLTLVPVTVEPSVMGSNPAVLKPMAEYVSSVSSELARYRAAVRIKEGWAEFKLFDLVAGMKLYHSGAANRMVTFRALRKSSGQAVFPGMRLKDYSQFRQIIAGEASRSERDLSLLELLSNIYGLMYMTMMPSTNKVVCSQPGKEESIRSLSADKLGDSVSELFLLPNLTTWTVPAFNVFYLDEFMPRTEEYDSRINCSKILIEYHHRLEQEVPDPSAVPSVTFVYDMLRPEQGLKKLEEHLAAANYVYEQDLASGASSSTYKLSYLYQMERTRKTVIDSQVSLYNSLLAATSSPKDQSVTAKYVYQPPDAYTPAVIMAVYEAMGTSFKDALAGVGSSGYVYKEVQQGNEVQARMLRMGGYIQYALESEVLSDPRYVASEVAAEGQIKRVASVFDMISAALYDRYPPVQGKSGISYETGITKEADTFIADLTVGSRWASADFTDYFRKYYSIRLEAKQKGVDIADRDTVSGSLSSAESSLAGSAYDAGPAARAAVRSARSESMNRFRERQQSVRNSLDSLADGLARGAALNSTDIKTFLNDKCSSASLITDKTVLGKGIAALDRLPSGQTDSSAPGRLGDFLAFIKANSAMSVSITAAALAGTPAIGQAVPRRIYDRFQARLEIVKKAFTDTVYIWGASAMFSVFREILSRVSDIKDAEQVMRLAASDPGFTASVCFMDIEQKDGTVIIKAGVRQAGDMTSVDPLYTRAVSILGATEDDNLTVSVKGLPGDLPPVFPEILLDPLLGLQYLEKDTDSSGNDDMSISDLSRIRPATQEEVDEAIGHAGKYLMTGKMTHPVSLTYYTDNSPDTESLVFFKASRTGAGSKAVLPEFPGWASMGSAQLYVRQSGYAVIEGVPVADSSENGSVDLITSAMGTDYVPVIVWSGKGSVTELCAFNMRSGGVPVRLDWHSGLEGEPSSTGYQPELPGAVKAYADSVNPFSAGSVFATEDITDSLCIMAVFPSAKLDRPLLKDMSKLCFTGFWNSVSSALASASVKELPWWDPRGLAADAVAGLAADRLSKDNGIKDFISGKDGAAAKGSLLTVSQRQGGTGDAFSDICRRIFTPLSSVPYDDIKRTSAFAVERSAYAGSVASGGFRRHTGVDYAPVTKDRQILLKAPCPGLVHYFLDLTGDGKRLDGYGMYCVFKPEVPSSVKVAHCLLFAHMSVKDTVMKVPWLKQKYLEAGGKPDLIQPDETYSGADTENVSQPLSFIKRFIEVTANQALKVKTGDDIIGVMGNSGTGTAVHLHLGACSISTDDKVWAGSTSSLAGIRGVFTRREFGGPYQASERKASLERLSGINAPVAMINPELVLSGNYPESSKYDSVADEYSERLTAAELGYIKNSVMPTREAPPDLVTAIAENQAFSEASGAMAGITLPPINLPYHDPYFIDAGFPFAVCYKDDIILTRLVKYVTTSDVQGRVSSSLMLAPGISVRRMLYILFRLIADPAIMRSGVGAYISESTVFPMHVTEFFNSTFLNAEHMDSEYSEMFGMGAGSSVFDWRKCVMVTLPGDPALSASVYSIIQDPELLRKADQTYWMRLISEPGFITVSMTGFDPSFSPGGEASLMLGRRRWTKLYRADTSASDNPFRPNTGAYLKVTSDTPEAWAGYEEEALKRLEQGPSDSSPANMPLTFYDWKAFFKKLLGSVR